SPEQLEAFNPAHPREPESLDGRSDLYSLGVVLWELLTGSRPFPDERLEADWSATLEALAARRRAGADALAGALPAGCPEGLDRVLLTCLAPDPARRYPSGEELARQLELCLQPRARELLHGPGRRWGEAVRRFPLTAVLLAALVPNLLAALFHFTYNRQEIVAHLPGAEAVFWDVQLAINGTAFPLGLGLLALLAVPVARGLRRLRAGEFLPDPVLGGLGRRCLRLGRHAAGISLAGWLLAGLAYPVGMAAALRSLPLAGFVPFTASLVLCGLIAAVYPLLLTTFLSVRAFYPALVRPHSAGAGEVEDLVRLGRSLGVYLFLAASLPMLAVMALV